VPAVTIDRQCGSSQQALQFAAQAVMSGTQDVVIASGVESMTRVPMGLPVTLPMQHGIGTGPFSKRIQDRFGVPMFSQFVGAEMIARKYQFRKEELDAFALDSHRKAARATDEGAFEDEIVPLASSTRTATKPLTAATKAYATAPRSRASLRSSSSRKAADQRRQCVADLRRRQRCAGGQRGGSEGAQPHAGLPGWSTSPSPAAIRSSCWRR
jgi:acetyl-CoA acetyltransferase